MGRLVIGLTIALAIAMAAIFVLAFKPFSGPPEGFGADFPDVVLHGCYDGDTCTFTIPGVHPLLGRRIRVRLAGIDTPEIKGKCASESRRAREAKAFLNRALKNARQIRLLNARRGKYFRIVADIEADGVIVNSLMIQQGLGRPYDGGKREGWCG